MSRPRPTDETGIAIGDDHTILQKQTARAGVDLDERIERRGMTLFGDDHNSVKEMWRAGMVDLGWSDQLGDVTLSMTGQQRTILGKLQ